jgi:DNA ligase (NAD+)
MTKTAFIKYSDTMANARNMVAGIVNAKTVDKQRAKDIDFVAYEMIEPWDSYTEQMSKLEKLGFNTVHYSLLDDINVTKLSETLGKRKNDSPYECDGIIISYNSPEQHVKEGNPDYAFAFKNLATLETAIVKVKQVEWNVSKDKYLKPKLILEPTKLSGVTIINVTGFNAKYIYDNCLGPGAEIELVRSGDVIPHILKVTKPASNNIPQFPPEDTYEWNETEVDIIALESSTQHRVKELTYFCKKIGISNLSEGNITKLIDADIDTIGKLLNVTKEELSNVDGFKSKMIDKIFNEIHSKAETMTLLEFMTGSNTFGHGMGERKIKKILDVHPDILYLYIEQNDDQIIDKIIKIDGFDTITATQFVNGIKTFLELLNTIPNNIQQRLLLEVNDMGLEVKDEDLKGLKVVFSGFRNKEWEKLVMSRGGEITTSVSKNTTLLVSTEEDIKAKTNAKVKKAFELGIKILKKEDFEQMYIK